MLQHVKHFFSWAKSRRRAVVGRTGFRTVRSLRVEQLEPRECPPALMWASRAPAVKDTLAGDQSILVFANHFAAVEHLAARRNVPAPHLIAQALAVPPAPTGLTATGASTTSITVSWNASTDPTVTSYSV